MSDLVRIWVAKPLTEVLEDIRKSVAVDMKKRYNLQEITIPTTLSSEILAAKHSGKVSLNFKIRKVGLNRGILELI